MIDWKFPANTSREEVQAAFGFVYLIRHLDSGRAYVGRKQTWTKIGRFYRPSDWRTYWGSCGDLLEAIEREGPEAFERIVLSVHHSKARLAFAEVEEQFVRRVLTATLPDGSPAYWNRNVAGRYFRSTMAEEKPWKPKVAPGWLTGQAKKGQPGKLTADAVREIAASEESGPTLAKRHGVSRQTISLIRNGWTWTEITR